MHPCQLNVSLEDTVEQEQEETLQRVEYGKEVLEGYHFLHHQQCCKNRIVS